MYNVVEVPFNLYCTIIVRNGYNIPFNGKENIITGIPEQLLHLLMVICHKVVLKSVSYPKIVENTPILIEQSIACNVYT